VEPDATIVPAAKLEAGEAAADEAGAADEAAALDAGAADEAAADEAGAAALDAGALDSVVEAEQDVNTRITASASTAMRVIFFIFILLPPFFSKLS
jgi:hypothetical protein